MKVADIGIRFGNYLIDNVIVAIIIMIHAFVLDGLLHIIPKDGSPWLDYTFLSYILDTILYLNISGAERSENL